MQKMKIMHYIQYICLHLECRQICELKTTKLTESKCESFNFTIYELLLKIIPEVLKHKHDEETILTH